MTVIEFPATPDEAKVCVHGNIVWFGSECGECESNEAGYAWTTLPSTSDGITTSADFGSAWIVEVFYNTDPSGEWVSDDDYSNRTLHGPMSREEADAWVNAYPEDKDLKDIAVSMINFVRPTPALPVAEPAATEDTWTFVGHWEGSEIVVEYVLPGEQEDDRIDTGHWPEGLWAACGTGATQEEAQAAVVAEYEAEYRDLPEHRYNGPGYCAKCGEDCLMPIVTKDDE
jgi:hypothetical protein